MLIIVEGIEFQDNTFYWWGGNLKGVAAAPVMLQVSDRIVYSAHDYPSSIYQQTWFSAPDYPANLPDVWDSFWGYIPNKGIAPLLMGEFGTKLETESDRQWLKSLVSYLGTGTDGIHWLFWSWNPNSEDTNGLLLNDWITVDERKLDMLKTILPVTIEPSTPVKPSPGGTRDIHPRSRRPKFREVLHREFPCLQRLAIGIRGRPSFHERWRRIY